MEAKQLETTLQEADGLLKEGYYDQALEALSGLDEDSEAGGLIACMKGCAFLQLEQDEQAHLCFGAALDKGFVNKELYINLGIVKSRIGNYKQAEQMFRQAADLDPVDVLPLNRIILLRLGRGDFAGAEAVMDELMRRNPELVDGYHCSCWPAWRTGSRQTRCTSMTCAGRCAAPDAPRRLSAI